MGFDSAQKRNLERALQCLCDVLGVGLVVLTREGEKLTEWLMPSVETPFQDDHNRSVEPVSSICFEQYNTAILHLGEGRRRFATLIVIKSEDEFLIQSSDLRTEFSWVDGQLSPQLIQSCNFEMETDPAFLLNFFLRIVCDVSASHDSDLDSLDVENIRRIGLSLSEKINCRADSFKPCRFSLSGTPRVESFFSLDSSSSEGKKDSTDLSLIFHSLSRRNEGAFDLLSLTGDSAIVSPWHNEVCAKYVRKRFGSRCFESDITCLIFAAINGRADDGSPKPLKRKCHIGFTEVFAPVLVDGLIVGIVFGGQLVEADKDIDSIVNYLECPHEEASYIRSTLKRIPATRLQQTERDVAGLARLVGVLFGKLCLADNEKKLREKLVPAGLKPIRQILVDICQSIKLLLGPSECSIFRIEGQHLILAATTSEAMHVKQADGTIGSIGSSEAIGKIYYRLGEGLTGSVAQMRKERFEPDAMVAVGWVGNCREKDSPRQVYIAPVLHAGRCYGVIRAVCPAAVRTVFPESHRNVIKSFANEIGIVLHNDELRTEKLYDLQHLLAVAAHEYKGPLHNILSVVTAWEVSTEQSQVRNYHQYLKEEVYRAKRNMENYLSFGISEREEQKYNFKRNNIGRLVIRVALRFELAVAKKGLRINIDDSVKTLPESTFDWDRMDQVFSNIIDNAVKYAFNSYDASEVPEGVSFSWNDFKYTSYLEDIYSIKISAKEKQHTITVSVRDMGLGVPSDMREVIFVGYLRPVEDLHKHKPGTGLGLMIAKKYVLAHNGTITVHSVPYWRNPERLKMNEGYLTTFTVSLPKVM